MIIKRTKREKNIFPFCPFVMKYELLYCIIGGEVCAMKNKLFKNGLISLLLIIVLSSVSLNDGLGNPNKNNSEDTSLNQSVSTLSDEDDMPDY